MAIKTWIFGLSGRMGQALSGELSQTSDFLLLGGSDAQTNDSDLLAGLEASELILDFSSAQGSQRLYETLAKAKLRGKSLLLASTGVSSALKAQWAALALGLDLRCLMAANTSLGLVFALEAALSFAKQASALGFDIEIEETHHKHKLDAPSGTALYLAEQVAKEASLQVCTNRQGLRKEGELGVHASRGGGAFGEHRIRFLGEHEELTISHRAYSRALFAKGALALGRRLLQKPCGSYELRELISK